MELAIRGKFVPQDPNDEPASVLLDRIRAEKERLVKKGKINPNRPLENNMYKALINTYMYNSPNLTKILTTDLG